MALRSLSTSTRCRFAVAISTSGSLVGARSVHSSKTTSISSFESAPSSGCRNIRAMACCTCGCVTSLAVPSTNLCRRASSSFRNGSSLCKSVLATSARSARSSGAPMRLSTSANARCRTVVSSFCRSNSFRRCARSFAVCSGLGARRSAKCTGQFGSAQTFTVRPRSVPSTTMASIICLHGF